MRSAAEIRQSFIDFFCRKHGHTFVPGAAVIPHDDPTLLFTNAGMNQFKPLFLGTADRGSEFGRMKRAANSQPCIRAGGKHNDLDDVGHDTYHHTFFEMLGNWSFGDYFKREAITWAWELLTKEWGLDPRRLHATYFGGDAKEDLAPDHEARDLWKEIAGLADDHVHPGNKKDNFWEMGDTGPCGPCSEIHVDLTPDFSGSKLVNAGDARVIEIWNNVFIQFNRGPDSKLTPLPAKHVDTGMGLERVAAIIQGHKNNYATDLFVPIIQAIEGLAGHEYGVGGGESRIQATKCNLIGGRLAHFSPHNMKDTACRVIADHIRTLTFAISDGCPPDKDGRGFVLRRILRRAVRYGWQHLGLHEPFLCKLVPAVVDVLGSAFPQLTRNPARIIEILRDEEESFGRTLDRGLALFEEAATTARRDHRGEIQGNDAFKLHDTYGFPIDLTEIMAEEKGLKIDIGEYERLMEDARKRSRTGGRDLDNPFDVLEPDARAGIGVCDDSLKYVEPFECSSSLAGLTQVGSREELGRAASAKPGAQILFGTIRTSFYAEQGGQVADTGTVTMDHGSGEIRVTDVRREGDAIIHVGVVERGEVLAGTCRMRVDVPRRQRIMQNHTATHILNWSLREVLDKDGANQLQQKGSLVDPEKTRFDFSHNKAVEPAELEEIEAFCDDQIRRDLKVETNSNDPVAQSAAMKINGLRAVFGEKYPDRVRVVSIGVPVADLLSKPDNPEWRKYSIEFCGGTHVKSTSEIDKFAIISEEAVAKGIRRIVGVTGQMAREAIDAGARLLKEIATLRSGSPADIVAALPQLQKAMEQSTLRVVDRAKLRAAITDMQQIAKKQQKESTATSADTIRGRVDEILSAGEPTVSKKGDTTLVVAHMAETPADQLKIAADMIKQRSGSAAILFGATVPADDKNPPKALLLAAVTDDLIKKGVKAGDWIKAIAPIVEGGGGGPPTMAQAGGKNPAKLPEALEAARAWIIGKL